MSLLYCFHIIIIKLTHHIKILLLNSLKSELYVNNDRLGSYYTENIASPLKRSAGDCCLEKHETCTV